jgi:hypothetical protein
MGSLPKPDLRSFRVQLTTHDDLSTDRHLRNSVPLYKASQVLSLHTKRRMPFAVVELD